MRQEVYRVAFDEASAELSEILSKFEALRLRKDRIEKVVEALKPLVGNEISVPAERGPIVAERQMPVEVSSVHPASEPVHAVPVSASYPTMQPSDPFARRVESAVGQSSSAKDVSEYSRLFNTGVSRGN